MRIFRNSARKHHPERRRYDKRIAIAVLTAAAGLSLAPAANAAIISWSLSPSTIRLTSASMAKEPVYQQTPSLQG